MQPEADRGKDSMSKRIVASLAACALMLGALAAPGTSVAKKRSHARTAKALKADCWLQPLDDALGQIEADLAPIIRVKLRLCGPVT